MYRLSIALIYALTLVASHAALAQDGGAAFDKSKVPAQGSAAGDFVPVGWLLEGQASGDLNGDGKMDIVTAGDGTRVYFQRATAMQP